MTKEQEELVLDNEKLIYSVLKKYKLYAMRNEFYDLGMIGLVKGAGSYKADIGAASTYLYKCIANEILIYLRKHRPQTISLDTVISDDENISLENILSDKTNVQEEASNNILLEQIKEKMKLLSDKEQYVLIKTYELDNDEKNQSEMAKYLKVSQASISRIKDRAIEKLKREFYLFEEVK